MISTFLMTYNKKFLRVGGSGNAHGSVCQPGNGPHFYFRRCSMTQETWISNATLNDRIAFLRGLWGYKKVQMAAVLSISGPYLSEIESGKKSNLSGTLLKLISSTFFVSVNWIITGYVSRELRNQLETARLNKGLSVRDVASNLAVPEEFICHIEYGNIDPSETLLEKLFTLYGIAIPVGKTGTSLQSQKKDRYSFHTGIRLRLRAFRYQMRLSQTKAAALIGTTQQQWALYETGTKIPHTFLRKLRKTFQVDLNWLITGETPSVIEQAPINTQLKQLEECFASDISPQPESGKTGIPERPFLAPVNNVKKGRKSWRNAIVKLFSRKSVSNNE